MNFKNKKYKLLGLVPLLLILILSISLRLLNLGYSDFQGDEIKALFLPDTGQKVSTFLLTQRKGPIQFLITFVIKFFDPQYSSQFFARLPFSIAGIAAVYYFYKFIRLEFNSKIAFYAALFLATNGFFIAFSRIVQYQSFVILFMILSLYSFSLASKSKEWEHKGLYFGFIFWALSILSHYDGVFIFPFVTYLLFRLGKKQIFNLKNIFVKFDLPNSIKHLFISSFIFIILVCLFYIPFYFNLDDATKSYWAGRLEGTGGKLSSSKYLFTVYHPIYIVHIYFILFIFGILALIKNLIGFEVLNTLLNSKFKKLGTVFLMLVDDNFQKLVALNIWFLIPFFFMEVLVDIPGTHIYTYLLPMFIYLAYGIEFIEFIGQKLLKHLSYIFVGIGVFVVFSFIYTQVFAVFVDHAREYPWEQEKFLFWEFPPPSPIFHLSMFGFPYYRHWDEIGTYIKEEDPLLPCPISKDIETCPFKLAKIRHYSTNERSSISRYHILFNKDTEEAGYFVHILHPQSFTPDILNDKAGYWASTYDPILTLSNCPEDISTGNFSDLLGLHVQKCNSELKEVSKVYYMLSGELETIQKIGF